MPLEDHLDHDAVVCQACRLPKYTTREILVRRAEWTWPVGARLCDTCLERSLIHLLENLPVDWTKRFLQALAPR